MNKSAWVKNLLGLALAASLVIPVVAADAPIRKKGLMGITKPSEDVTLSFSRPGRVKEVLVKEGDEVKRDVQIIASQDDSEEQAAVAIDVHKRDVSDPISAEAEVAVRANKQADLDRMLASGPNGVGKTELEAARTEVVVADARIKLAEDQKIQDDLKVQQGKISISKLKLTSPIDGVVVAPANPNQSMIKAGEMADGSNAKVLRIVKIDPLWVETPVPTVQARKLKKDDAAQVSFSDNVVLPGKIVYISKLGDSASETIMVRLEVANPDKLQPGENVFVNFDAGIAKATENP